MDHIRSRPQRRHRCACKALESLSLMVPLSRSTRRGGTSTAQFQDARASTEPQMPARGDQDHLCSYFCTMHKKRATSLGTKLLTLKKSSYQPPAARPRSFPAPPPEAPAICSKTGAITASLFPGGSVFFGGDFIAPGACQFSAALRCKPQGNTWDHGSEITQLTGRNPSKRQSCSSNSRAMPTACTSPPCKGLCLQPSG